MRIWMSAASWEGKYDQRWWQYVNDVMEVWCSSIPSLFLFVRAACVYGFIFLLIVHLDWSLFQHVYPIYLISLSQQEISSCNLRKCLFVLCSGNIFHFSRILTIVAYDCRIMHYDNRSVPLPILTLWLRKYKPMRR